MRILLVEDDELLGSGLDDALTRLHYAHEWVRDGRSALRATQSGQFDLIILDLGLPQLDGMDVLQRLRSGGNATPVLILSARDAPHDRIVGLNAGADDYLPKPFDLDELEARIRALNRRHQNAGSDSPARPQEVGGLRYEPDSGAIYHRAQVLELTPRELALLKALLVKPGHAVSKARLFEVLVPGEMDVQYEAVEVVVYRRRKNLAGTGVTLMTLRGLGYLLREET